MLRKFFFQTLIALFLVALIIPASSLAASGTVVSTFEELSNALMSKNVSNIVLADDIEITDDIELNTGRKNLTIDGRGYALTFDGTVNMQDLPKTLNITVKNAHIYGNADVFYIADDSVNSGVVFTFENITFYGGTLISLGGGYVKINGGEYTFEESGYLPMIEADTVEVSGQVTMGDAHGSFAAPMIKAAAALHLSQGSAFEMKAPADLFAEDEELGLDGRGLIELSAGAKIEFEQIDGFDLRYLAGDICQHEHDEACGFLNPENGICNHDCARERYACCRNALILTNDDDPAGFSAYRSYKGSYQLNIEYLDGVKRQYDSLASINCGQLRGVKSLSITYIPPETIDVSGKIVWKDEDNAYDTRPKSVKLKLYRNGVETDRTMTVSKTSFKFSDEKYQDDGGKVYTYTVRQIDDLSPEYKTSYKDSENIITNKLVTCEVKVHYIDARSGGKIAGSKVITVPKSYSLTIEAKDIDGYLLADGAETVIKLRSVKKDAEYTFYYDEMISFEGVVTFSNNVSSDAQDRRLTVNVYRNVWQDFEDDYINNGGAIRTQQEIAAQAALMPGFTLPDGYLVDSFLIDARTNPHFFQRQLRKYDGQGNPFIYSFAAESLSGELICTLSLDRDGRLNINVEALTLTVTIDTVIDEDPQSTPSNGTQYQQSTQTYRKGGEVDFTLPETITLGGRTATFVSARCDAQGGTNVTVSGRQITCPNIQGDFKVTANYRFPLDNP